MESECRHILAQAGVKVDKSRDHVGVLIAGSEDMREILLSYYPTHISPEIDAQIRVEFDILLNPI